MLVETISNIQVNQISQSRIHQLDESNIQFGRLFSDHMVEANFEDGKWSGVQITPYADLELEPSCLVFHYGQAIFEGMKAFKNESGEVYLFRPQDNIKRFNKSAERMCMPKFPEDLFMEALTELIRLDSAWVPSGEEQSLYIRPFMIATDEYLGVKPSEKYKFLIITSPAGAYYKTPVRVKVELEYTRAIQGGTGYAKAAGNYAGSLYPARKAQQEGFHQLLWTDGKEHKYIEESGTMNVMFVKENTIHTPGLSDSILSGITRDSVLKIAKSWGYDVVEDRIAIEDLVADIENGSISEAFGTGTAATIAQISEISYKGTSYSLPPVETRKFSNKVMQYLRNYRKGREEDAFNWRVAIQ